MTYEYDPIKNQKNQKKHHLSFEEVASIFNDPYTILDVYDYVHSVREHRYYAIGYLPERWCKVKVCYTYRRDSGGQEVIRIISARKIKR